MPRRAIGFGALLALTVLALGAPADAQTEAADLDVRFESVSLPESTDVAGQVIELIEAGGANRYVAFNGDILMDDLQAAGTVDLELFDGVTFSLSVTDSRDGVAGSRFWAASGDGAMATFTELNGTLDGRIADTTHGALYRIIGVDGQLHFIAEDTIAYPQELEIETPQADESTAAAESEESSSTASTGDSDAADISANAGPQVDVLAWYDDDAVSIFGSEPNAEAAIAAAYNTGNAAADASGALVSLNVVELKPFSWTAPASAVDAIVAIRDQSDGILDEVHAARDAVGADLVAIIGDLNGGCGIGYVPQSPPSSARADLGFTYTDAICVGGNLTLVHETGHNFGASHDIGASQPGPGLYPYSQGYVNPVQEYRTIMSYTTVCNGCLRVPYFSNPTATYLGNPTGDPGKDNARTLTESAAGVASYRIGGDTTDPDAAIIEPAQGAMAAGDPIVLFGTAEDNVGVDRVRLTIYETDGYSTWNGTAFTAAFSTVNAVLDPVGSQLAAWSYEMNNPPDGRVVFTAVAFDAAGNFDASPSWRLFNISNDFVDPDATITDPTSGQTVSGFPVVLQGTATDDTGVSRVRLTIYETDGFATWDGAAFTPGFSTVDAEVAPDGSGFVWAYNMGSPPETEVVFTALAYDAAGNTDPVKPWRLFSIDSNADTEAPDAVIENPTQGQQITTEIILLEGIAADNVGVTRVRLTIYNTASNDTWDGEEFTSTYSTVDATLTPDGTGATWSYNMGNPGINAQIVFTALAYDDAGNTDPTQPWRLFELLAS